MEELFWEVEYTDGTRLAKYGYEVESGRWVARSFHDIEQKRVKTVIIYYREGAVFHPIFAFRFHPEIMKLILFYRREQDVEVSAHGHRDLGLRSYLIFGYQITVDGRAYKVLWSAYKNNISVAEDRRRNLPLTPGG